ncbi:hypothetical protein INT45_007794, partial [Circinella minor]
MTIESEIDLKSDHKPVCISFTMDRPPPSRENHPRQLWNLKKIETVHDQIKSAINTNSIEPDINYLANQLTDCIHTSLDESVGRRTPRPPQVKWFWNKESETAFQDREQCYHRKVKATGIQQGIWNIKHKEASKQFDTLGQKQKRQAWNNFINKLSNNELSNTTATIKRIRQNKVVNPTFSDMAGPEVAANKMSQQLARTFSAPGMDHLRAEMLGPITEYLTNLLTDLFILCWKWSKTPDSWRLAQIVPIYKKGDANDPANYRPISLLSVLSKILEICLQDELHSASPDIDISQDHNNNSSILAALDIQSAYDTVDRAIIWRALEPIASPPLLGLLQSLFDNVSIQVLLSGTTSRSFWPATGVLQGSILSPHLYSIYINSLPQFHRSPSSSSILSNLSDSDSDFQDTPILSSRQHPHRLVCGKWINALLYADDVVLIGDRSNIQQLLNRAEEHSYQLGYRWNPSKCIVLQQPTSQSTNPLLPLYLYNQPLLTASTFVYLGIPFNASGMINNQQLLQRNIASALMGMRTLRTIG